MSPQHPSRPEIPGSMRVAVLSEPGAVVLEQRQVPSPGPREVLVRVSAVGVCGSDTHYYDHGRIGSHVVEGPLVLGHEASGVVAALGRDVGSLQAGQRVSIEPGVPDFTCEQCLAGRYNLCEAMRFYATPPIDGAFAEYVVVHEAFAHPVPDELSDEAAALLEPLSVGVWANRRARTTAGSRVLITGAGAIGLVNLQVAAALGATDITVSDVNPARLELARALGATRTIDARSEGLEQWERRPTVLLECSGFPPAITAGIRALAPAGRAVLIGMGGDEVPLPLSAVQDRELEVTGVFRYAGTWPVAIELVRSGKVDLDRLVTARFGLAEVEQALTNARDDPRALKAVVQPAR